MVCLTTIFLVSNSLLNVALATRSTAAGHDPKPRKSSTFESGIPTHPNQIAQNDIVTADEVNVYALRSSEPSPMGLADYGIGPEGAYSYSTSAFLGIARVFSLSTQNSTGGTFMSFQLNVVLQFTGDDGQEYVYWIQDVAQYDTGDNAIYFFDNVWNYSSPTAEMSGSEISGNGQVATDSGGNSYYYDLANTSPDYLTLPGVIEFHLSTTVSSQNYPEVTFEYNYQGTWQTFDAITLEQITTPALAPGFVVDGLSYNPFGTYYDAELVLGGEGSGWNTTDTQSNVDLQLQFWNGYNYQEIYNAYNFGSNTAEGISDVTSESYYFPVNGSLVAEVSAGAGSLGKLYQQSQIAIVSVESNLTSGTLYLTNGSSVGSSGIGYPFTGNDVIVTVSPGTYDVYLYNSNGVQVAEGNMTATPGQDLHLGETDSSRIVFLTQDVLTVSYSAIGGYPTTNPTITYVSEGQQFTVELNDTQAAINVDPGSTWSVSNDLAGSSQNERWQTNEATSGVAESSETINFVYYHQEEVLFAFNIIGGGSGYSSPQATYQSFGASENVAASVDSPFVWTDVGSNYSYADELPGSSSTERWFSPQNASMGVIPSPGTTVTDISPDYYNQYPLTATVSVIGIGSPSIDLNYSSFGNQLSALIVSTPQQLWADSGSLYSFPGAVQGATGERWASQSVLGGLVISATTADASYYHQFAIAAEYSVLGGGTYSPAVLNGTSFGQEFSGLIPSTNTDYWLDQGSTWSVSNILNGSSSTQRWMSNSSFGGNVSAPVQVAPVYYHQDFVNFSYSLKGGGNPAAPEINYSQFGAVLTAQGNESAWVDAGSSYNYSSVLSGSSPAQRWASDSALSQTANGSAAASSPVYYLQYLVQFDYSINGQGGNASSPVVNYTTFGLPVSERATNSFSWVDAGSSYSYPSLLNASDANERWIIDNGSYSAESGSVKASTILSVSYDHQYLVSLSSASPGGPFSPSSGWYDSGSTLNLAESAAARWQSEGWVGEGDGSFSGSETNAAVQVNSPIKERAVFYPGVLLSASGGGSVQYAYDQNSGTIESGDSTTLYVPPDTTVSVSASPSSFIYSFNKWTGASTASSSQSSIIVASPVTLTAGFGPNFSSLGAMAALIAVAALGGFWMMRRKLAPAAAPQAPSSSDEGPSDDDGL